MRIVSRIAGCSFLMLLALPGVGMAQDTNPPNITALSFAPAIDTSASSAGLTVNFTLTDDLSGVASVALGFVDPSGGFVQQGFKSFATPATSVTDSLVLTFPRFSPPGTWQILYVFVSDAAGNTLFLDVNGVAARGFPTALQVTSSSDTTPPNITAFTFTPATIDTTAASAAVTVNFTVTDDLSGASFFQVNFVSPSGNATQSASKSLTPGLTVTDSVTATFPRFSEPGTWTVGSVFVADAAGNTLPLVTADLVARGFTTTLSVTSIADTNPPVLTSLSFTPTTINVTGADAPVTLSFHMTDDASGATTFQATFLSPSGDSIQGASANFPANTSVTGTATATFPKGSEGGTWTLGSVFLSDAAGNTSILATADLTALGFPTQLTVVNGSSDTTPPVIVPTVSPAPNAFGWNTTAPVTVSWSVTDPESGITSSSGCGTTSLSAETAGVTFTCSATNGVGLTNSVSVTVRIDLTPPIVTSSVSPSPNAAGWNNTNVTVTWNLSDSISGISPDSVGCDPTSLTTETAGTSFTCMATNGAGLTQSATVLVKIDKTPPTATAAASPAPNGAGWNSTNVTVTFTGTDSLSGIASCTAPVTLSAEGPGQSANGTCTDVAGNVSATATASGINIDKTPPVVVPTINPAPNGAGWNTTSPVTVSWSVTEPTPGSSITSSSGCTSSTVASETAGTTFTCTATNIAGLTTTTSVAVKLDTTAPIISGSVTPAPNAAGWNNSNPTVAWSVSDPVSGIASSTGCAAVTVSSETTGTTFTCSATNGAGLSSSASITVKLDKTAPVASNVVATPSTFFINHNTAITATVTDSGGSNLASAQYNIDGGSYSPMTGTFGGSSANVSATTPVFTATGTHNICVTGTDVAGNTGAPTCVAIHIFTAAAPASGTTCNGAYNGTFNGTIVVSNGQVCDFEGTVTGSIQQGGGTLILLNATVGGSVQITSGGTFSINASTINGSLQVVSLPTGTAVNPVCGSHIKGSVQLTGNHAPVNIGQASSCAGNTIDASLQVQSNTAQTQLIGNRVGGALQDNNNVTTATPATQVTNNIITNALQCSGNSSIAGGGNTASVKQGQCSAF